MTLLETDLTLGLPARSAAPAAARPRAPGWPRSATRARSAPGPSRHGSGVLVGEGLRRRRARRRALLRPVRAGRRDGRRGRPRGRRRGRRRRRHRAPRGRHLALRRRPPRRGRRPASTASARSSPPPCRASGEVPQISVVLGPAAGGAAYGPALTDVVIMGPAGRVFVTGPDVVRSVTGEDVDADRLGRPGPARPPQRGRAPARRHRRRRPRPGPRGSSRLLCRPGRGRPGGRAATSAGPAAGERRAAPTTCARWSTPCWTSPGLELHAGWAPHVVTTLGRLGGRTVGVVANNPLRLRRLPGLRRRRRRRPASSGLATPSACRWSCWWTCPGYLPGVGQEWDGVVRRGAKLLHAFAEAVVPRVTLVTRKAYGGAYIAMNSRSLGATAVLAWPGAEIAVMGAESAVGVLRRRDLAAVDDDERPALRTPARRRAHRRPSAGWSGRWRWASSTRWSTPVRPAARWPGAVGRGRHRPPRAARQHPAVAASGTQAGPVRGRSRAGPACVLDRVAQTVES